VFANIKPANVGNKHGSRGFQKRLGFWQDQGRNLRGLAGLMRFEYSAKTGLMRFEYSAKCGTHGTHRQSPFFLVGFDFLSVRPSQGTYFAF
jgi:hypothetical protein